MSKYVDQMGEMYKDTGTMKKLTKEIKDALNKKKMQKQVDKNISDVIKGKFRKREVIIK